eukprot:scaffold7710_cov93-Skeletonema_dohrnii-CCMP3373.AAC.1
MPSVRKAGMFSDDTTCVTGMTGWSTVFSSASTVAKTTDGEIPKLSDLVKKNSTHTLVKESKKTSSKSKKSPKDFFSKSKDGPKGKGGKDGKDGPKGKGGKGKKSSHTKTGKKSSKHSSGKAQRLRHTTILDEGDEVESFLSVDEFDL